MFFLPLFDDGRLTVQAIQGRFLHFYTDVDGPSKGNLIMSAPPHKFQTLSLAKVVEIYVSLNSF